MLLASETYDFEIVKGDDFILDIARKQGETIFAAVPVNLAGAHAEAVFRWLDQTYDMTDANQRLLIAGTDGRITGVVPKAITATWPPGQSVRHQIRITDSFGQLTTILTGYVNVLYSAAIGS